MEKKCRLNNYEDEAIKTQKESSMQNFRDLFCKAYRKRKTLTRKRKEHEIDPRRKQEKAREVTVIDERNKQTNKQKQKATRLLRFLRLESLFSAIKQFL